MKAHPNAHAANDNLADLKSLVTDAETLMSNPPSQNAADAMSHLRARFDATQQRFGELYDGAKQKVVRGAKCTDTAIRDNPYQSLAIAAGVGVLIGIVLGRRTK